MRHSSLEGSSSSLSLNLPSVQLVLVWGHSRRHNMALRIENFGFFSWLLIRTRDQAPETIELEPGLHVISPNAIIFAGKRRDRRDRGVFRRGHGGSGVWSRFGENGAITASRERENVLE